MSSVIMRASRTVCRGAIMLGLAGVLFVTSATAATARSLEGVWFVQVTLRSCDTGAALGPAFNSLVTFASGGTIVESAGGVAFQPGQRTGGHGTWDHRGGHTYTQRMVALINFGTAPVPMVSPGFEAGWQIVSHSVELRDDDHMESSGTNSFYRANGELYRSGCSTATGTRFK